MTRNITFEKLETNILKNSEQKANQNNSDSNIFTSGKFFIKITLDFVVDTNQTNPKKDEFLNEFGKYFFIFVKFDSIIFL